MGIEATTIMAEHGTAFPNGTISWSTTPSTSCPWPEDWQWLLRILPAFLWFLTVVGTLGNLFVLSVWCFHKSRSTVAEIYLANLAAADLLLLCGLPFWAINTANNFYWPFGLILCKIINSFLVINLYSSIYFVVMVSIDRYLVLVKTMSLGRMRQPRYAKWNCFMIWVSALLLSFPALAFRSLKDVEGYEGMACVLEYPSVFQWTITTAILLNTVGFLIPVCIITYCSVQIIQALQNRDFQKIKTIQTEKKATILVFAVLLLFIICWLPFQTTTFIDVLFQIGIISGCAVDQGLVVASQIAAGCGFINSCLNPIVYVIVGKHFRRKCKEVYFGRVLRRPSSAPSMTTMEIFRISFSSDNQRKKSAASLSTKHNLLTS
ncbi:B2 bradykinin receptor isoform X2 [Ahaetulla prasina]|uniref:B2 bradykinin receptor isoform X2 n=1 Tax=Ahaetulla prasina TaxID=499056 RepID=UPI00264A25A0|nr:B2 bradykinin receptor isoform X2 [Ahaetulla prasina]